MAAAAWAYAHSPGLDVIRPSIENHLKQALELEQIHLGRLSWQWSGFLWLQSSQLVFANRDNTLAYHGGSVSVRVSPLNLLTGKFAPDHIRISGGTLDIALDGAQAGIGSDQLQLDNVAVNWRYSDYQGSLPPLRLELDHGRHSLKIIARAFTLAAELGSDGRADAVIFHCSDIAWLPAQLLEKLDGMPEINLSIRRVGSRQWEGNASAAAERAVTLMPDSIYAVQFNRIDAAMRLKSSRGESFAIEHLELDRVLWSLNQDSVSVHGNWNAGLLSLKASAETLTMPTIWSWLRPLGEEEWHHWLSLMQQGTAYNAEAEVALAWNDPLHALPEQQDWDAMRYKVVAGFEDLDLALGTSEGHLRHTRGRVKLDQDGLDAVIDEAQLPRELGPATGDLHIPWKTLDLHINGKANVDVAALLGWFGPADIADWHWNGARAESSFQLLWRPGDPEPKQASAELQPLEQWQIGMLGATLDIAGGTAKWDLEKGLSMQDMHVSSEQFDASLNLTTAVDDHGAWQLRRIDINGHSDFAKLAAHFQLPLADPLGQALTHLYYDGSWHGDIDLKSCGWQQFLGSIKKPGEPYNLSFSGVVAVDAGEPLIRIADLNSKGSALLVRQAAASISSREMELNLADLHTPSFSGALDINIPFDDAPWQLVATASYLNRNALPAKVEHPASMVDKRWQLQARIKQFDWDDARMQDVDIRMTSQADEIGTFTARKVNTAGLAIDNVDVRFSMPGGGEIDLRHFSADIEKQQLLMSASLVPAEGGGMHWRGFAELHGDFGQLMRLADLSQRFVDGEARLLFSGSGYLMRDQPWWQGLDGRLRMRADKGRVLEGGTMTTLLAVLNLSELHRLLFGQREDLSGPGTMYERLQMEAIIQDQHIGIRNVVMRATAFDIAGHGKMDLEAATVDLYLVARPLQNLDALLAKIPLVRDILGGRSHSLMRKVYHMQGPFTDARVSEVRPGDAGAPQSGIIERLFRLPELWFESPPDEKKPAADEVPAPVL